MDLFGDLVERPLDCDYRLVWSESETVAFCPICQQQLTPTPLTHGIRYECKKCGAKK